MTKPICLNQKEVFHVHTWRCGHAGEEREEAYIREAVRLGAERISIAWPWWRCPVGPVVVGFGIWFGIWFVRRVSRRSGAYAAQPP